MFSLHPQASRDFSKLFSQALGQVLLPPAPCSCWGTPPSTLYINYVQALALTWTCVSAHTGTRCSGLPPGSPQPIALCAASAFARSLPEAQAIPPSQSPGYQVPGTWIGP